MSEIDRILYKIKEGLQLVISQVELITDDFLSKDIVVYINVITSNFTKFKNKFKNPFMLNILFSIKTFRNIWAHQGHFTSRELYRFYDDCSSILVELFPESEEYNYVEFQRRLLMKELNGDMQDYILKHSDEIVNWKLHSLVEELELTKNKLSMLMSSVNMNNVKAFTNEMQYQPSISNEIKATNTVCYNQFGNSKMDYIQPEEDNFIYDDVEMKMISDESIVKKHNFVIEEM